MEERLCRLIEKDSLTLGERKELDDFLCVSEYIPTIIERIKSYYTGMVTHVGNVQDLCLDLHFKWHWHYIKLVLCKQHPWYVNKYIYRIVSKTLPFLYGLLSRIWGVLYRIEVRLQK